MNPNHRMPVMVDHEPKGGGEPIAIFESGAIMMYIAEKAGKFYPQDAARASHEVNQWVIWQMANQGPKSGECGHFRRLDQTKRGRPELRHHALHRRGQPPLRRAEQPALRPPVPGRRRVHDRRHDLLSVDHQLEVPGPGHRGVQALQALVRGAGRQRPAVQKGMAVGADLSVDDTKLPPEEQARIRKMLYNQRARPVPA